MTPISIKETRYIIVSNNKIYILNVSNIETIKQKWGDMLDNKVGLNSNSKKYVAFDVKKLDDLIKILVETKKILEKLAKREIYV